MQEKIIEELRQELKEQIKENQELEKKIDGLVTVIDLAKHFIKKYETIRGYYEYEECGYDEYNYEDDLKQELLEILERVNEE